MSWKCLIFLCLASIISGLAGQAGTKEYLTDQEMEKMRETYDVDARLKSAEDRLNGIESEPGDPLEFYTPENMLDSYYQIIRSAMMNLDDAAQNPGRDNGIQIQGVRKKSPAEMLTKGLKTLKSATEKSAKQLEILKKIAEEKNKEELWNLVNSAIDVTNGAHEGAEYGLSKQPSSEK